MDDGNTSRIPNLEHHRNNTPARPQHASPNGSAISSGLAQLDAALGPSSSADQNTSPLAARWSQRGGQSQTETSDTLRGAAGRGGIRRGEVTEITGPKGVGKTAFAMGVAARALLAGEKVVWIDSAGPVCRCRFRETLAKQVQENKKHLPSSQRTKKALRYAVTDALQRLLHFYVPSIAHIMALISSPPPGFPPQDTGLLVIDNISTLFNSEFKPVLPSAQQQERSSTNSDTRHHHHHRRDHLTLADRQDRLRWKLVANLLSSLRKLAVRLDSGVLAINEMGSRFRPGQRPMLHQALSGVTWERGVAARIMLYFGWVPARLREQLRGMRCLWIAEVLKAAGRVYDVRAAERVVPYLLLRHGICDLPDRPRVRIRLLQQETTMQHRIRKRKTMVGHSPSSPVRRKPGTDADRRLSADNLDREEVQSKLDTESDSHATRDTREKGLEADAQLLAAHLTQDEGFT